MALRGGRPRFVAIAVASVLLGATVFAQAPSAPRVQATEIEVKAAFLYHFAQLVTWPEGSDADPTAPITIAIVGGDPFGDRLDAIIGSETVRGRPIRLIRSPGVVDLLPVPQIVYLGSSDRAETERSMAALANKPVLTVSANPGFARRGGMIEFRLTPDRRVTFDINVQSAVASGLKMSSQLLKIARIVETSK